MNFGKGLDCDKYALTMMQGYWKQGRHNEKVVFDAFFRKNPFQNGYTVFAGLESIVEYIQNLRFTQKEIDYLREDGIFEEGFLKELENIRFTGELYAAREGEIIFPNEPIFRVNTRIFEAILIEAELLLLFNSQTLIATKASRMVQQAGKVPIIELGKRRAQGNDASVYGARSAYLAGFVGTSNMTAGQIFNIPTVGTMAHAWVQTHDTELEAFRRYAEVYPDNTVLLVDTYDVLNSGIPNAIIVGKELEKKGYKLKGIRIDSGDISYLSQQARAMLEEAGLPYVSIVASNDLDENLIADLKLQEAEIDTYGIGTKAITGGDQSSLGGVYKVVARQKENGWTPVIKISENPEKIPNPGMKKVLRILDKRTGKFKGDYICFENETVNETEPLHLVHPEHTHKDKIVEDYTVYELLQPIFQNGQLIAKLPTLEEVRTYHKEQLKKLWPQYKRRLNPEIYAVSLSNKLYDMKKNLLSQKRNN